MNVKQSLPTGIDIFGLHIQFYAIFILCGALLAFFLSSYRAHKKGYPWDFFEIIFFTAFPAGIVGARIWYVIAEWNKSFAGGSFWVSLLIGAHPKGYRQSTNSNQMEEKYSWTILNSQKWRTRSAKAL